MENNIEEEQKKENGVFTKEEIEQDLEELATIISSCPRRSWSTPGSQSHPEQLGQHWKRRMERIAESVEQSIVEFEIASRIMKENEVELDPVIRNILFLNCLPRKFMSLITRLETRSDFIDMGCETVNSFVLEHDRKLTDMYE
ncbi:hypothetical protein O9G_005771 [Rozella allomycis CSF55]|uniref:Uncharacterized protein n=1 Tax=Rozella allomycis (strain CSF55) TaxID=988480 RepID=A0A075B369_ROZAC|nr:hypothetical protein O9G_005771 [Rozella allomycis CSF55]|eukprot:EPZ37033.1 hypothetical protein O9G_005771 [Rozella allomycis CSF55]